MLFTASLKNLPDFRCAFPAAMKKVIVCGFLLFVCVIGAHAENAESAEKRFHLDLYLDTGLYGSNVNITEPSEFAMNMDYIGLFGDAGVLLSFPFTNRLTFRAPIGMQVKWAQNNFADDETAYKTQAFDWGWSLGIGLAFRVF